MAPKTRNMDQDSSLARTATKRPPLPAGVGDDSRAEKCMSNFKEAKELRENWEDMWQEAYDYCMPNRSGFFEEETKGRKNTDDILDSTAVHALTDFTSRIRGGVVPDGSNWIDFRPGTDFTNESEIKEVAEGLEEIQTDLFESLGDSNASSETDEAITEMSIGTGVLHVEEGGVDMPFRFTAVPLSEVYVNQGPFGALDEVYRDLRVRAENIKIKWPDAVIPKDLADLIKDSPRKPVHLIEATYRDWTSKEHKYRHEIVWPDEPAIIWSKVLIGEGSSPWIPFRWAKAAGEVWGRGPLLATLPDVRTVNLTVELILENGEKAISGMWQSDDETINPDTIQFVPGTVIPKLPGSSGLEPLQTPSRLDFAQLILADMRDNIRKGLFSEPLGPNDGTTPASATEASFRISDLNRRISSPFGRLVSELVKPLTKRLLYIRREAGKIPLPTLNGRTIKMVPVSPLAKAADHEQILSIDRFLEQVGMRFGPEMLNLTVNAEETAKLLAELHGVPARLSRSAAEIEAIAERVASMQAQRVEDQGGNVQQLLPAA